VTSEYLDRLSQAQAAPQPKAQDDEEGEGANE